MHGQGGEQKAFGGAGHSGDSKDLSGLKLFPNSFGLSQDSAFQHDSGVD